jgi:hypothetical protein
MRKVITGSRVLQFHYEGYSYLDMAFLVAMVAVALIENNWLYGRVATEAKQQ